MIGESGRSGRNGILDDANSFSKASNNFNHLFLLPVPKFINSEFT